MESSFPKPLKITSRLFRIFLENSPRYSQVKVHHRYHIGTVNLQPLLLVLLTTVKNFGNNIRLFTPKVNSTTQRCPNKIFKLFWLKIFPLSTGINDTGSKWNKWCTFSCEYFREFSKKFEMAIMGYRYSELWGNWFLKKTWSRKISWHCSLKAKQMFNIVCTVFVT